MKRILSAIIIATFVIPNGAEAGKASAIAKLIEEGGEAAYKAATKSGKAAEGAGKAAGKKAGHMHWFSKNAGMATGRWIASNKGTKGSKSCYDCGGDGKSWLRTCKTCNGSGSIRWITD